MKKKLWFLNFIPVILYMSTFVIDSYIQRRGLTLGDFGTALLLGLMSSALGVGYSTMAFVGFLFANGKERPLDIGLMIAVLTGTVISFCTGFAGMYILSIEGAVPDVGLKMNTCFGICYSILAVIITIHNSPNITIRWREYEKKKYAVISAYYYAKNNCIINYFYSDNIFYV